MKGLATQAHTLMSMAAWHESSDSAEHAGNMFQMLPLAAAEAHCFSSTTKTAATDQDQTTEAHCSGLVLTYALHLPTEVRSGINTDSHLAGPWSNLLRPLPGLYCPRSCVIPTGNGGFNKQHDGHLNHRCCICSNSSECSYNKKASVEAWLATPPIEA